MQGKFDSRPRSIYQTVYDWINDCDIPHFDIIVLPIVVFIAGLIVLGSMFALRHLDEFRSKQFTATQQTVPAASNHRRLASTQSYESRQLHGIPSAAVPVRPGSYLHHGHPQHPFGISKQHPLATEEQQIRPNRFGPAAGWAR